MPTGVRWRACLTFVSMCILASFRSQLDSTALTHLPPLHSTPHSAQPDSIQAHSTPPTTPFRSTTTLPLKLFHLQLSPTFISTPQPRTTVTSRVARPPGIKEAFQIQGALHIFDAICEILSDKQLFDKMTFRHRPVFSTPSALHQGRSRLCADMMSSGWAQDAQNLVGDGDILALNVFSDKTRLTTNKTSYPVRIALSNLPADCLRSPAASRQIGIIQEATASSSELICQELLQSYNEASFHDCLRQIFQPLINTQMSGVDLEVGGTFRKFHPLVCTVTCDWPEAQRHAFLNSVDGRCPCRQCITAKEYFVNLDRQLIDRQWVKMKDELTEARRKIETATSNSS